MHRGSVLIAAVAAHVLNQHILMNTDSARQAFRSGPYLRGYCTSHLFLPTITTPYLFSRSRHAGIPWYTEIGRSGVVYVFQTPNGGFIKLLGYDFSGGPSNERRAPATRQAAASGGYRYCAVCMQCVRFPIPPGPIIHAP